MARTALTLSPEKDAVMFIRDWKCRVTLSPAPLQSRPRRDEPRLPARAEEAALCRLRKRHASRKDASEYLGRRTEDADKPAKFRYSFIGKAGRMARTPYSSVSPLKSTTCTQPPTGRKPAEKNVDTGGRVSTVTVGDGLRVAGSHTERSSLEHQYRSWAVHWQERMSAKKVSKLRFSAQTSCSKAEIPAEFPGKSAKRSSNQSRELSPESLLHFTKPLEPGRQSQASVCVLRLGLLPADPQVRFGPSPVPKVRKKELRRTEQSAPRGSLHTTRDVFAEAEFPVLPGAISERVIERQKPAKLSTLAMRDLPLYRLPVDFHLFRNVYRHKNKPMLRTSVAGSSPTLKAENSLGA